MAELQRALAAAAAAKSLPPPPPEQLDALLQVRPSLAPACASALLTRFGQSLSDANRIMLSDDRATVYLL